MTSIGEDNDGKTAERSNSTFPLCDANRSSLRHCVALPEMIYNQYNQVSDGDESNDARIFQRV
jgi:hypothetical protein